MYHQTNQHVPPPIEKKKRGQVGDGTNSGTKKKDDQHRKPNSCAAYIARGKDLYDGTLGGDYK